MKDLFKKKTLQDMKRENANMRKDIERQREYVEIREENERLKAEQAKLKKRDGSFQFDPDGFMSGVDMLIGSNKNSKRTKRAKW